MPSWDIFNGSEPIAFLSEEQCLKECQKVQAAEENWTERSVTPDIPSSFYTLGGASYLDTKPEEYEAQREKSADGLLAQFDGLYRQLCECLGKVLNTPCQISTELSPPGFHIFRGDSRTRPGLAFGGSIHVDLPHLKHVGKYKTVDDVLSFTLPLALPKGGGGMYFWKDKPEFEIHGFTYKKNPEEYQWLDQHKQRIDYQVGKLYIHQGLTPHQMASFCRCEPGDWRITLQGHGILCDGAWHLYF